MPYVESEVIIKHATNPAGMGIIVRGIDPTRAPHVLGLERTMQEGKISYLIPKDPGRRLRPGPHRGDDDEPAKGVAKQPPGMGIIVRGIDAIQAPRVLGLEKTMQEGKIAYLSHPDEIPVGAFDLVPTGDGDQDDDARRSQGQARRQRPPAQADRGQEAAAPSRPCCRASCWATSFTSTSLRVFVGSDVDIACPMCGVGPMGPMPKLKEFRVAGHFYSGMYEFDSKLAYIALPEAQKFLNMPGEITGIEVRTTTPDAARAVADEIARRLGPGYEVRSWEELNRGLFTALKLEKVAMFVVLTFIALVASFSIVSNLIMLVTEKAREVAILKSMGARDGAILRVFFAEGLYIGLLGLALGLVLGIGGCLLLSHYGLPLDPDVYYIQRLPVVMRVSEIAAVNLAALGLCCLATLYPALLASRMRPVDGLRYE